MQNSLFLLSFCFLLTACVYNTEPPRDVYAQSDLLPPKTASTQPSSQTYQQPTPPIVVPQQTVLPSQILSNPNTIAIPQQATNPTPFVQTIVIPQATPYPGYQPPVIPSQIQPAYTAPFVPSNQPQQLPAYDYPTQNINTPTSQTYPAWTSPQQNQQSSATNVSINELIEKNNSNNINIPRW